MAPMPRMWPRLIVPSMAPWLRPPKRLELGSFRPTLGCLMVALPMAMAMMLARIITRPTFGDQETVAGARARRGAIMEPCADALSSG